MIKDKLKISIDLGASTVKCAYAYLNDSGNYYGKLCIEEDSFSDKGYPSLAFYNENSQTWVFGEKVFESSFNSYKTVVKIKDLLSLLLPQKAYAIEKENITYYNQGYDFPIFYFPEKIRSAQKSYREAIDAGMTFKAVHTPKQVCQMFFNALKKEYVQPEIDHVIDRLGLQKNIDIVAVYPTVARASYIEELVRLVKDAFQIVPTIISAPKAVGVYAVANGYLPKSCHAIVVNIGESDISVAKIEAEKGYIKIDGADAHNDPEELGGNSYDEALGAIVQEKVAQREVLGMRKDSLSFHEVGTHEQQFNLLQNIKRAKLIFGLPEEKFKLLKNKVRINADRDVRIEVSVTKDEFLNAINNGVSINGERVTAVSERIASYIMAELNRKVNQNVTKVILSGGASQTVGLHELMDARLKHAYGNKIQLLPFEGAGDFETVGEFKVNASEKHIYSASVGASILATNKYVFKTLASLSYGTWYLNQNGVKTLKILIRKGMEIPQRVNRYGTYFQSNTVTQSIDNEEFFSTPQITEFAIGDRGTMVRQNAQEKLGLKVLTGKNARICFAKVIDSKNVVLTKVPKGFRFEEGIEIDQDGRAKPYIVNADSRSECVKVIPFFDGLNEFVIQSTVKEGK